MAHNIGESHAHPASAAWLDYAIALLAVGLSSAFAARRGGADGTLHHGAVWVTRACAVGIVLCAVTAAL